MSSSPNDQLLSPLIELQRALEKAKIPLILGGGMSLYIRMQHLPSEPSRRYPFAIETRSTNDLDLFLGADLIVDAAKVTKLREIIAALGYAVDPNARNFQFVKEVEVYGSRRQVRVELLSAPPSATTMDKVEIKGFRIKPIGADDIHAYLTDSAAGIDIGQVQLAVRTEASEQATITIPSAYNYLILKLHAFDDRKSKKDAKSNEGRHHAYDIFATVSRMSEDDWATAAEHLKAHSASDYLARAIQIRRESFSSHTAVGVIRIRESKDFQRNRQAYEPYLDQFISDMNDLFP